MPNDCWNYVTITSKNPLVLNSLLKTEIRKHNREAIESHPLNHMIKLIEGSSIDPDVISDVIEKAKFYKKILVFLDSNHTHSHVLAELEAYAPLVSPLPAVIDVAEYAAPPFTCASVGNVFATVVKVADAPVIPVKSPAPATATVVDVASELSK